MAACREGQTAAQTRTNQSWAGPEGGLQVEVEASWGEGEVELAQGREQLEVHD